MAEQLPKASVEQLVTEHLDIWVSAIEQKSASGRGSSKKFSLYGIEKLRQLILELAVRGRLVPKIPSAATAIEVFDAALISKDRLAIERKIRKDKEVYKPHSEIEYPDHWVTACIGQVAHVLGGKRVPKGHKLSDEPTDHVYLRVTDMKKNSIDESNLKYISLDVYEQISKYIINKEDVYVSIAGTIGSTGTIPSHLDGMNLTENASKLVFRDIVPRYLVLVIASNGTQSQFNEAVNQMAQPKLSLTSIKHTVVPIPPLEEQHRIVDKVDELMSLCDALDVQTEASLRAHQTLVESLLGALLLPSTNANSPEPSFAKDWQLVAEHFDMLFTTSASIDTLKQTILQLAVMGKLVEQDENDEPASKLLARIAAEKAQLIADKKIKKQLKVDPIGEVVVLPSTWQQIVVQDFADIRLGSTPSRAEPSYWSGGIPWVSSGEVAGNIIKDTSEKITQVGFTNSSTSVIPKRSLLMAIIGQGKTRGQTALLGIDACTNQNVAAFVFNEALVVPEFVWVWAQSKYEAHRGDGRGGAQPALNGKIVRSFRFPLPPHEEQHRIVAKVDELMVLCDQLKARLTDAQTIQLHLADSMTQQALYN
ncbi:restriction endonuclease subunit S [Vibrio crassostreae]|uniref:restriction endonuclease subunit S n=1 Tax=Vibrio crassostreae TaxID=246167 RepID=UPI0010511D4A|nr:restriction endonuclease subunit S [Vibrio crassostreae]TCN86249.1 type I restriction enzyme S subunit [Vibrio crassostreae]TCV11123.1 type I restriction enzyme S subunit [Vibrio crassostreae]TWD64215.1 type I restriction enzyme S subunit [Vibrio crassostreae]